MSPSGNNAESLPADAKKARLASSDNTAKEGGFEAVCRDVTERIMSEIEKGNLPWRTRWDFPPPQNLFTGHEYNGYNHITLLFSDFKSPYWGTAYQASLFGGRIKPGAISLTITAFVPRRPDFGRRIHFGVGDGHFKSAEVFNSEQMLGVEHCLPVEEKLPPFRRIERAARIVRNMPNRPIIEHGGGRASYSWHRDRVRMPQPAAFFTEEEYYSVLLHELVHSTGAESRLDRRAEAIAPPGGTEYAAEELVAELGAVMLCCQARIASNLIPQAASYIDSWVRAGRLDPSFLLKASTLAQRAANFILRRKNNREKTHANRRT